MSKDLSIILFSNYTLVGRKAVGLTTLYQYCNQGQRRLDSAQTICQAITENENECWHVSQLRAC